MPWSGSSVDTIFVFGSFFFLSDDELLLLLPPPPPLGRPSLNCVPLMAFAPPFTVLGPCVSGGISGALITVVGPVGAAGAGSSPPRSAR